MEHLAMMVYGATAWKVVKMVFVLMEIPHVQGLVMRYINIALLNVLLMQIVIMELIVMEKNGVAL